MEGPNHEIDWSLVDEEVHLHINRRLATMSAFLNGRVNYELMASVWPTADTDPDSSPATVEFAHIWQAMPQIVYSRTLTEAGPNTTIVRDVVADEVRALKAQPGGDMVIGGATLAASFLALDLVDELALYLQPVVLGRGRPLFPTADIRRHLELIETRTFTNGVINLRYRLTDRPPAPAS